MNTSSNNNTADDRPDANTVEGRQQIVAMQALTRAITGPLSQAVVENVKAYAVMPAEERPAESRGGSRRKSGPADAADESTARPTKKSTARPDAVAAVRAMLAAGKDAPDGTDAKDKGKAAAPNREMGLLGKSAGALGGTFFRMLGPLGTLAGLLGSSASGLQTLGKAAELLTMVLAPVLLPVTLLLATAMIALSEILFSSGLPVFKMLFGLMKYGVMYLQVWADTIKMMIDLFEKLANWTRKIVGGKEEKSSREVGFLTPGQAADPTFNAPGTDTPEQKQRDRAKDLQDKVDRALNSGTLLPEDTDRVKALERGFYQNYEGGADSARHNLLNGGPAPKFKPGTMPGETIQTVPERGSEIGADGRPRDGARGMPGVPPVSGGPAPGVPGSPNVKGILGEVIESFRLSVGPKASLSDLAAPRGAAQLAVFGDPIEKRQLDMMVKIVGLLESEFGKMDKPADTFRRP